MTLTPFNRYLFSEADRIHVVDECVLLEISPSKLYIKIQAPHFTQWVKEDRVVFLEDLGKAFSEDGELLAVKDDWKDRQENSYDPTKVTTNF